MKNIYIVVSIVIAIVTIVYIGNPDKEESLVSIDSKSSLNEKTAVFANGCFWCVEHD